MHGHEHLPPWLISGATKRVNSVVSAQLVDTAHSIKPELVFSSAYCVCGNLFRGPQPSLLVCEMVIVNTKRAAFHIQKKCV
uniref:Uncharacterized protein n=1 Tax=Trichobilharzia regenti TaxID=157069 RepID=A0AA85IZL9_TRIRE|nr:unnamed protein product [Trichobilharzia regenti]